jgi:hypothetical protein
MAMYPAGCGLLAWMPMTTSTRGGPWRACQGRRRIHVKKGRIHACPVRRRIHACHVRRRIHACQEKLLLRMGPVRPLLHSPAYTHTHTHTHTHTQTHAHTRAHTHHTNTTLFTCACEVDCTGPLHYKCTRALTFEHVCQ